MVIIVHTVYLSDELQRFYFLLLVRSIIAQTHGTIQWRQIFFNRNVFKSNLKKNYTF
jgi:hypothetical protein